MNADGSTKSGFVIDEIVREGARRMLAAALEDEVNRYLAELAAETIEAGHRLAVRNSHHRSRTVATPAGPVEVTVPRVNDKVRRVGDRRADAVLLRDPAAVVPQVTQGQRGPSSAPLLHLHGLSSGDFVPVLE
ncbi:MULTISPECIES: hypothetical protein [unclassified Streptomyces]|uniref:transposase n=1 Tax=Streptomyces sp. NBC_00378 TaxID=2975732 RepID=UPI002B1E3889|nr:MULTISPECIES: hypothetical protein [unclassified Streptomyces]